MSEQFDAVAEHEKGLQTVAELAEVLATAGVEPVATPELVKEVNKIVSTENVGLPAGGEPVAEFNGTQHGVGELMSEDYSQLDKMAEEVEKDVDKAFDFLGADEPDVASVIQKILEESGWQSSAPIIVEAEKSQIADVLSCSSVPGFWSVQIRYTNDAQESVVRTIRAGQQLMNEHDYRLWESKHHYIEARFSDYSGIVLVPCPEVVTV